MAVVSDLAAIALFEPERDVAAQADPAAVVDAEFITAHYLRFIVGTARDPGVNRAGAVAHDINIDAVVQLPFEHKDAMPFVVTAEPCLPATLSKPMAEIGAMDFHVSRPWTCRLRERRRGVSRPRPASLGVAETRRGWRV